jgi:hypothetical protein
MLVRLGRVSKGAPGLGEVPGGSETCLGRSTQTFEPAAQVRERRMLSKPRSVKGVASYRSAGVHQSISPCRRW